MGNKTKELNHDCSPIWNLRDIKEANWLAEIMAEIELYRATSKGALNIIDSFNLHRRPGWCYEKLVN